MASPKFKFSQPAVIDISIVTVSFNTREILLRCLSSVQKHTEEISYEVIVIDNASEDETVGLVTKKFHDVKIIANKYNRGFSAANNQGIILSKGRKIVFLNPDTMLTENSFKKIERRLRVIIFIEEHRYSILNNNCEHFLSSKSDR